MLRKLFSQTVIYGGSHIISKFLNYLLVPYLTRILGKEVYGDVSLYYSWIPFANALLTMGLATGYFRFAAKCKTEEEKKVLFSTLWTTVSLLSVLFFVVASAFSGLFSWQDVQWYMVVTVGIIMIDNINAIPFASLREQSRPKRFMLINVTNVVVNVALCFSFYELVPGAKEFPGGVLIANLIASLVSFLMLMPSSMKLYVRKFSKSVFKTVTRYSIPIMIAGIMGFASDFIDRQMLKYLLPQDIARGEIGVYSAVAKIAALMVIFRQIYTLGAEPFFLQNFKKDDFKYANAAAMKYFIIAGLAIFLGITLFENTLAYIVGSDYREGMVVVPLLSMANLLMGVMLTLSFWYKQADRTDLAIWITLTGLIVTVVMNYVLIPIYSYEGAAWTHLAATFSMVALSYFLGQKYYPIPYDLKRILLYFVVAMGIYVLSRYTATLYVGLQYSVNILLLLSYALLAYKLEWKKLKS